MEVGRHNRVSPWEIEPASSVTGASGLVSPGAKRSRIGFPTTQPDFSVPKGLLYSTGSCAFVTTLKNWKGLFLSWFIMSF